MHHFYRMLPYLFPIISLSFPFHKTLFISFIVISMGSRLHLSYGEILKYTGGRSDSKSVLEGVLVLNAGPVEVLGYKTKEERGISLFALVLQTSGLTKGPLQVTGELLFDETSCESGKIILHMQSWAFRQMHVHRHRIMVFKYVRIMFCYLVSTFLQNLLLDMLLF
jgi:hypothetical protein